MFRGVGDFDFSPKMASPAAAADALAMRSLSLLDAEYERTLAASRRTASTPPPADDEVSDADHEEEGYQQLLLDADSDSDPTGSEDGDGEGADGGGGSTSGEGGGEGRPEAAHSAAEVPAAELRAARPAAAIDAPLVKRLMEGIGAPPTPAWASLVNEEEWRARLVAAAGGGADAEASRGSASGRAVAACGLATSGEGPEGRPC